jgi:hypothetical protein
MYGAFEVQLNITKINIKVEWFTFLEKSKNFEILKVMYDLK